VICKLQLIVIGKIGAWSGWRRFIPRILGY